LIREIHGILVGGSRGADKTPGEFRRSQNWVGGTRPGDAAYVPPNVPDLMPALDNFEKFLHDHESRTTLLIKTALAHAQFETIHPFLGGNGRVGRLLITFLLCAEGALREPLLYLSLYLKQNRAAYYDSLQKVRIDGDWEQWIEFFLRGVASVSESGVATMRRLLALVYDAKVSSPRMLTADRGDAGRRLDLVLHRHLTDVDAATRTRVQAWIESGLVTVNGTLVRRVSSRAALGDVVAVAVPPAAASPRPTMAAERVGLHILYEDDHLLALDKPAGIVVHPTYMHPAGTIMNALLWHARAWPAPQRPSLLTRLDKLTSGIVVVAKTAAMHAALQRSADRSEKDYLAVVYGRVNVARGEIDLRLGRDASDDRRVVASAPDTLRGAASLTRFARLARVPAARAGLSLLRCRLVTGRTHQIRVHLAARGWPIVGDSTYGEPRWSQVADPALAAMLRAFPRQALHAWRVALTHPITEERLQIEAPLPLDVIELLTASGLAPLFRTALAR
jgi:RluA family pseudouridine synthase